MFVAPAHAQQTAKLRKLSKRLTGSFSSARQAGTDTAYFDVSLNTARIWTAREDGYWLYVEQAISKRQTAPYRQRVYHLTQKGDTLMSEIFELKNPQKFINQHKNPDAFNALSPDSLVALPGCTVYLTKQKKAFKGATRANNCANDFRGASYATSEVNVYKDRLESWDRGYDAQGNQIWGAVKGPYIFRKNTKK